MNSIEFGQANTTFSMICRVKANIRSKPETIWALLTDAGGFPRWDSTVTRIDGHIREGERLRIHVPGTSRTFRPMVSGVRSNRRMTWSDGIALLFKGTRTFGLQPCDDGSTDFIMKEKFEGLIFALVKNKLPDFQPIFEQYASDLQKEAESHDNE